MTFADFGVWVIVLLFVGVLLADVASGGTWPPDDDDASTPL